MLGHYTLDFHPIFLDIKNISGTHFSYNVWHSVAVVFTTTQLHLIKSELGFFAFLNPAGGLSDVYNGENLRQLLYLVTFFRVSRILHVAYIM